MKKYIPSILFIFLLFTKSFSSIASFNKLLLNETLADTLHLNFIKQDLKCNGDNSGYAVVKVSGGKAPYTYSWSNNAIVDSIGNLSAGTYRVTVSDANGNTKTDSVVISQPKKLILSLTKYDNTCPTDPDGRVFAYVDGGTYPYMFKWNNGSLNSTLYDLKEGIYSVEVTDKNGCYVSSNTVINDKIIPLYGKINKKDISCFGSNDGSISIELEGGPNYNSYFYYYSLNGVYQYNLHSKNASNLKAGNYQVSVRYAECYDVLTLQASITEPDSINISVINAGNRNFTAQATGGVGSYTYKWNTGQTGATLTNPSSGTYTVTVIDGNGCSQVYTTVIDNPEPITLNFTKRDLKCNGDNSGYAVVKVSGGKAPYTFLWSNSAVTDSITNLSAGTYTVTVTDALGQRILYSPVSIQEPEPLKIQLNTNPTNRRITTAQFSGGDGNYYTLFLKNAQGSQSISTVNNFATYSISLKDSQGQPLDNFAYLLGSDTELDLYGLEGNAPFSIKFTFGEWENSFNNLINGVNYLVLKDKNGCEKTYLLNVNVVPPLTVAVMSEGVPCYQWSNGTATAKIKGGTGPYRYLWSNGQKTSTISNLTSGKYSVIVQDTVGFVARDTVEITQPSPISISVVNAGNRNFTAQATGGVGSYTYHWNTLLQEGATLTNPPSGTYTVAVRDGNGCLQVYSTVIDNPEPVPLTISINKRDLKCNGDNSGYAKVEVSGGKAPYSYLWSNSAVTDSIGNLSAGTYKVTVTDALGNLKIDTVVINQPEKLMLRLQKSNNFCRTNSIGKITAVVKGSTDPYIFKWNDGSLKSVEYKVEDYVFSFTDSLKEGKYSVRVTDVNGCYIDSSAFIINEPLNNPIIMKKDASCFGFNDGSISIENLNNNLPVINSYYCDFYLNGVLQNYLSGTLHPDGMKIEKQMLKAGDYTISLSIQGCNDQSLILKTIITQPPPISISVVSEVNNNLTAQASGGVGSYTYKWNTGQEGATLYNPTSGTYTVTVTDGNTCSQVYTTVIDNPEPVSPLTLSSSKRDLKCNGDNSGYAKVQVSGGKAPYTFLWSNSAVTDSIINVSAGIYTVTVTDALGNIKKASVVINQPEILSADVSVTYPYTGFYAVSVETFGGTSPYQYEWAGSTKGFSSKNGSFSFSSGISSSYISITDANGCYFRSNAFEVVSVSKPPVLKCAGDSAKVDIILKYNWYDLETKITWSDGKSIFYHPYQPQERQYSTYHKAGSHKFTIFTRLFGEYEWHSKYTDSITITEPSPISISVINAGNHNFTAQATGGVGSYTYQWNTGQAGATLTNPTSGTYTVTVTDGNACSKVYTTVIDNPEPEPLIISISKRDLKCNSDNSGYAKVQVSGGKAPYTYSWNNDAIVDSISNLSAGTYTVTVTDAVGQTIQGSVSVQEPQPLKIQLNTNPTNKNITAQFIGGNGNYTLLLNNGQSSQSISNVNNFATYSISLKDSQGQPLDNFTYLVSNGTTFSLKVIKGKAPFSIKFTFGEWENSFSNLINGVNYLILKDKNGCEKTYLLDVEVVPSLAVAVTGGGVSCYGGSNGTAITSITGGITPYSYLWSNGQKTPTISNLTSGKYSVIVQDAVGFVARDTVEITQPLPISISVVNSGNRNFTAEATGGVGSYTYQWNTGQEGATLTNPPSGTYTVTVTDGNACSKVYTTVIDNPNPMVLSFASSSTRCYNEPSASASVSVVGGKEPYRYLWSNGETNASITNLYAGNYTVTVTDEAGQTVSGSVIISQPSPLQVAVSSTAIKCFGANDGTALVNDVSGGTPPYSFEWNTGQFTTSINNLGVGNYSVLVRDEKGCSVEKSVIITEPSPITYTFDSKDVKCFNGNDGVINFYAEGGTGSYKYFYNENNSEKPTISTLSAGKYSIRVEDTNACQSQLSEVNIAQPNQIQITLVSEQTPKGFGTLDGSIKVNISGGTITDTQTYQTLWFVEESNLNSTNQKNGEIVQNTLENIKGGTYNLLVKDLNYDLSSSNQGCMATFSHVLNQPSKLILASTITDKVSCYGKSDAKVSVQAEGGVKIDDKNPYTYEWYKVNSNELLKLETTSQNLEFVDAGTYRVVATDANAIKASVDVVIENPSLMTYQFTTLKNPSCPSSNDGLIAIEVSGGVGTKTVTWSNNLTGFSINNLEQGKYYGVIQDEANCIAEVAAMLNPQENVVVELLKKKELICTELCDGAIEVKVSGNAGNYELTWSNGMKGTKIDNLCAGQYSVEVNTDLGCKTSLSNIDLKAPEPFKIEISNDLTICADAKVTIDAQALLPNNQNYEWTLPNKTKQTNPKLSISEAGTYIIEITNKDKCKATDVFNVKVLNKVSGVGFALSSTGKLGETIYAINLTPTEVATEWKTFGSAEIVSNAVNLLAFKAKSEGDIKVVLQSIDGDCNLSVEKTISINGSVEIKGNNLPQNSPIETLVLAYPNPNSGNFFVESDSLIIGNVELTIYDSNFAKKLFYEQYDNKDKHKIEVSLPQLSTRDVIYLEIKANNQRTVKKIMIL